MFEAEYIKQASIYY